MPLGDPYTGTCQTIAGTEFQPDEATLKELCNLGYSRSRCERFPDGEGPDAVRFSVGGLSNAVVEIRWVMERDHHPFGHGVLEYSLERKTFPVQPADPIFERQARAYVASYLRRKAGLENLQ